MVQTRRALIVRMVFVTYIQVVVAVTARTTHGWLAHHGYAAPAHPHGHACTQIRTWNILQQELLGSLIDPRRINHIVHAVELKLLANNLWIGGADRLAWIVIWVRT